MLTAHFSTQQWPFRHSIWPIREKAASSRVSRLKSEETAIKGTRICHLELQPMDGRSGQSIIDLDTAAGPFSSVLWDYKDALLPLMYCIIGVLLKLHRQMQVSPDESTRFCSRGSLEESKAVAFGARTLHSAKEMDRCVMRQRSRPVHLWQN